MNKTIKHITLLLQTVLSTAKTTYCILKNRILPTALLQKLPTIKTAILLTALLLTVNLVTAQTYPIQVSPQLIFK